MLGSARGTVQLTPRGGSKLADERERWGLPSACIRVHGA